MFKDERIAGFTSQELGQFIDCYQEMFGLKKPLVYLDEIQNIDGWEKFVRRLASKITFTIPVWKWLLM